MNGGRYGLRFVGPSGSMLSVRSLEEFRATEVNETHVADAISRELGAVSVLHLPRLASAQIYFAP